MKHEYNPATYMLWFIEKFGKKKLHELTLQYNTPRKFTTEELKEMIKKYENKLKK
jgi:hypothetical protein